MESGEKCICQENDWHNAYGETNHSVHRGMRLTILESIYVAGTRFYSFEETPKKNFYLSSGFKPLRNLN